MYETPNINPMTFCNKVNMMKLGYLGSFTSPKYPNGCLYSITHSAIHLKKKFKETKISSKYFIVVHVIPESQIIISICKRINNTVTMYCTV